MLPTRLTVTLIAMLPALSAGAQDLSAEAINIVYDVASPARLAANGGVPPAGEMARAIETLHSEGLLPSNRFRTPLKSERLDTYGKALMMGTRAPAFATEIGAVRDAAVRGDLTTRHAAIEALYRKAGRNVPDATLLKTIDNQVDAAVGNEPEETLRQTIDKPGKHIEIALARRAGVGSVEVTQDGADGKPVRTVFRGEEKTVPTSDGVDLETVLQPAGVCSMNERQSTEARSQLEGVWKDGDGNEWTFGEKDATITSDEKRPNGYKLSYAGTYKLGKIVAFHGFVAVDDMGDELPPDVRSQLVSWSPKLGFTIRLDLCGATGLKGTWASQHVTYSGMDHAIKKIHDPFDLPLVLSRGLQVAQGGRWPDEGP